MSTGGSILVSANAPPIVSPEKWQAIGPFADGNNLEAFKQPADEIVQQLSRPDLPGKVTLGGKEYVVHNLAGRYGWLRLEGLFQQRPPYPRADHSIYVRASLPSNADRPATLRLGLDNWAIVYLNGQRVAMLDHAEEFETAKISVQLKKGDNQLVIKNNNRENRDRHIWAVNCVID